jgi:hypothetical protein
MMDAPRALMTEIHGFRTPGEFRQFLGWIEQSVAKGNLVEVAVGPDYGAGQIFGGRWFRDTASGNTWRLIAPDFPFRGLWEVVHGE